jgi:hypothetical protein
MLEAAASSRCTVTPHARYISGQEATLRHQRGGLHDHQHDKHARPRTSAIARCRSPIAPEHLFPPHHRHILLPAVQTDRVSWCARLPAEVIQTAY